MAAAMIKKSSSRWGRLMGGIGTAGSWLVPGLGVKRWFFLILLGTTLIGFGLAVIVLDVYRSTPDTWWLPYLSVASLRFLSRPLRAILFAIPGLAIVMLGIWELNRTLVAPFVRPGHKMVDTLRLHRQRERGPRLVVIGGGHGLATCLRGLKQITHNLTAVVTVADDGGSSGRLRRDLGILPPGDVRNCLAALSDDEALLSQLFQYRFPDGDAGLDGHSFGNLFITALVEITGSFEEAVAESGRVLAIQGRVLPSTLHNVRLVADVMLPFGTNEVRLEGESNIPQSSGKIRHVWLEPNTPPAFPDVIQALLSADVILIGPGSLYTSLLPNLLVPDLLQAIRASRAIKVYVCNIATQPGETDHYTCGDHLRALVAHVGPDLFDVVVANDRYEGNAGANSEWVTIEDGLEKQFPIRRADLIDTLHPWRHDAQKLTQEILDLIQEQGGSLVQ
jgi:uncharacterized cofD-like protein